MAIAVSQSIVQQQAKAILDGLGAAQDHEDLLSLADEAYHKLSGLQELLKHAIVHTDLDRLELETIVETLEQTIRQVECLFDEAVDLFCPGRAYPVIILPELAK